MLCVVSTAGMEKCLSQMVQGWARCPSTISSPPSKIWLWDEAKVRPMGCQRDIMRMYIWYIYIYITYICMYIYICRELGFTDISDHLDAWNGLKRSETALRSVLTGNRSRNSRKMKESNAKTHPNSLDILLTLKPPEKNGRNFHWQNNPSPISSSAYRQVRKLTQGDAKRWGFWTSGGGGVQHMWLGHQGSNNKLKQVTPHKYNPPIQKKKIVDLKPAIIGIFTNKHGNMSNKKWI